MTKHPDDDHRPQHERHDVADTYSDVAADLFVELVQVRASDGVHFEREGGDIIAREVLKVLNQQFDLTSWRKKAQ